MGGSKQAPSTPHQHQKHRGSWMFPVAVGSGQRSSTAGEAESAAALSWAGLPTQRCTTRHGPCRDELGDHHATPHCVCSFFICSLPHQSPAPVLSQLGALCTRSLQTNRKAFCASAKEKLQIFHGLQATSKEKMDLWRFISLNISRYKNLTGYRNMCVLSSFASTET